MIDSIWRFKLALADLERAAGEGNRSVARYLLDTEIMEALSAIRAERSVDPEIVDSLLVAVEAVRDELRRAPKCRARRR